jgi:hypothetical protein
MLTRASLLCILLSFLSTTTQAWPQQESQPNSLRILVEGEPPLSLSFIKAARRIMARYDLRYEFVDGPDARHDLRLIVSGGDGHALSSGIYSGYFFYNSVVALAPDGKLLFIVTRSGVSDREVVEDAVTVAIKRIYTQFTLPQKQSPLNSVSPQEAVKPSEICRPVNTR